MSRKIKYIQLSEFDKVYSKCIIINLEEQQKEENKKNEKKGFVVWQIKAHANNQALPCALDLAHGKVKFKFHK